MGIEFNNGSLEDAVKNAVRSQVEERVSGLLCPVHQLSPQIEWSEDVDGQKWSVHGCCQDLINMVRSEFGAEEVPVDTAEEGKIASCAPPYAKVRPPSQALVYQILIASPSDVQEERKLVRDLIYDWNASNSADTGVVLLPVMWETHSAPEMGDRPQAIINRKIVEQCHALVAMFWTRIGTPTGNFESGTVEEIEQFVSSGRRAMLYFSSKPVAPDRIDHQQMTGVRAFQEKCRPMGLIDGYDSLADLKEKLWRHLIKLARDLASEHKETKAETMIESLETPPHASSEFNAAVTRSNLLWRTEKDSDPHGTAEGKKILRSLGETLVTYAVKLSTKLETADFEALEGLIKTTRELQRHQTYLDGGASFNEFWKLGDQVYSELQAILRRVKK